MSNKLLCYCLPAVPGYFFTIAFIEKMGRKAISYMGFIMMTILLVIVSAAYDPLRNNAIWAFIVLYALTFVSMLAACA